MKLTIEYSNKSLSNQKLDAIIVFIFENSGLTGSGLNSLPAALKKNLNTSLKLKVFTGKKDTCQQLFSVHANIPQILAVGVGKKREMNSETLRRAAGKAGKMLTSLKAKKIGYAVTSHLQSERDLRIIPFRYSKLIFRKIKCLYADQMTTKKQIMRSVIVITIS